jgi:putative transposase
MRLIDEQYYKTPFYGIRRITAWLRNLGHKVNRKRVKRLMELICWQTIYHKRNTHMKSKENPVYPYLLKDLDIDHPNHV